MASSGYSSDEDFLESLGISLDEIRVTADVDSHASVTGVYAQDPNIRLDVGESSMAEIPTDILDHNNPVEAGAMNARLQSLIEADPYFRRSEALSRRRVVLSHPVLRRYYLGEKVDFQIRGCRSIPHPPPEDMRAGKQMILTEAHTEGIPHMEFIRKTIRSLDRAALGFDDWTVSPIILQVWLKDHLQVVAAPTSLPYTPSQYRMRRILISDPTTDAWASWLIELGPNEILWFIPWYNINRFIQASSHHTRVYLLGLTHCTWYCASRILRQMGADEIGTGEEIVLAPRTGEAGQNSTARGDSEDVAPRRRRDT
ncbi:hypothetical protein JCGZ_13522 [Jatropha curcas]|uniref:Aminotransferase-like plant mobile domain-containing protein n=1 Tax=Jatropha curcas TaxID=180498 RepID=A0A067KAN6_JATCU|nr:hypothetical protein JCGZ_13522 [Jatropha curcas]